MSENLFYNRDENISGISVPPELSGLSLTPVYGSRVEFRASNNTYITDNFYYNLIPLSINSLTAKFEVRYDVNKLQTQQLATFFESKSGHLPLEFTPDNSVIYKTVSGVCDNYAINFINNQHFEVASRVNVDHAPTLLNWSGMGTFTNLSFTDWNHSTEYQKYDVIYTGVNQCKLDNFYYCSGNHTSTLINGPTGSSSLWSQKFFFDPDVGIQNDVAIKANVLEYKNSFVQRLKTNNNIATFGITYTYKNITDKQLKAMLHFLENKGGYRRFEHQIPSVYNRPKVYYSPLWTHTWDYYNSNTLTVELVEDPLGVIPTGT
jgi:phage-related protein|tara:strand:- start:2621 stop:3577 length:957 start_codon:yes stop_codon:yes gene_type:complete